MYSLEWRGTLNVLIRYSVCYKKAFQYCMIFINYALKVKKKENRLNDVSKKGYLGGRTKTGDNHLNSVLLQVLLESIIVSL